MNPEQEAIYKFLGELSQSMKEADQGLLSVAILGAAFDYIQALYTKKDISTKEVAIDISNRFQASYTEMEDWKAKLEAEYPIIG